MQGLRRTPGRESDVLSYLVAETLHQFVYSCEEAEMKTCENGVVKSFEHVTTIENGSCPSVVLPLIFVLMNRTKQTSKPTSKQSAHKKASIDEAFAKLLPNLLPVTVDAVPAKVAPDDANPLSSEAATGGSTLPEGGKTAVPGPAVAPTTSCRKRAQLPDFRETFFKPVRCGCERSAIYVSLSTRRRVMAVLHLLGGGGTARG